MLSHVIGLFLKSAMTGFGLRFGLVPWVAYIFSFFLSLSLLIFGKVFSSLFLFLGAKFFIFYFSLNGHHILSEFTILRSRREHCNVAD